MRSDYPTVACWELRELNDLVDLFDGPHATPKKVDDGPIFLGISNLKNGRLDLSNIAHVSEYDFAKWTRRVTPRAGDIVFSYETRLGETAQIPHGLRCCLGRRMGLLRVKSDVIHPRFLLYAYLGPQFQQVIRNRTIHGSTVNRIPLKDMGRFKIVVPPRVEQERIVLVLGAIDDKIDSNRRLIAHLEETASAVFRARFVDFVGVEEFEESEIGPIPRGWRCIPLSEVIEINPRVSIKRGVRVPFLEMANIDPWATRPLTINERPYHGGARFERGDTLMARITGCIEHGKGAFVDSIDTPAAGSTEFLVLRPRPPLTSEAVFFLSRTERVRERAIASMTGSSGRQRVSIDALSSLRLAIPPDQDSWANLALFLRTCLKQTLSMWQESRTLTALRDTLLPKLISGEIRVPDTTDPEEVIGPAAEQLAQTAK